MKSPVFQAMKAEGQTSKAPLPKWAEAVRRKYLGGEASMFLLHRNVFDRVLHDGKFWSLEEFLARVLLWDNKARILTYDPASKVRFLKGGGEKSEELLAALGNEDPLAYLEGQLHGNQPTAVILSYAGSIVPPGDEHFLSQSERGAPASLVAVGCTGRKRQRRLPAVGVARRGAP